MKIDIKALVEQVVKEELASLQESVDKKYTHFLVDKESGKIVTGWDYKGTDKEDIKDFLKMDLKDMDINPKDVKLVTKGFLISKGIDPFDTKNWKPAHTMVKETTIIATVDGTTGSASPEDKAKMQAATAKGDDVKVVKKGQAIAEKKEEKEEEGEDKASEDTEAPKQEPKSISAVLADHISSAIDAAAQSIQDNEDSKYKKVLGKVIKNLTAAQGSLEAVTAHETKISEQKALEEEKETVKRSSELEKILKQYIKNPEDRKAFTAKYRKVIKASKNRPVEEVAKAIWKHALKEGFTPKQD